MKVGVLLLGRDGADGRQEGSIILLREFPDDKPVYFGRRCKPPSFHVVVLNNTRIADLPAGFRDYGWHTSRKRLDYTALLNGMAAQLRTKETVGMDPLVFRLACKDRGDYWQPEQPLKEPAWQPKSPL